MAEHAQVDDRMFLGQFPDQEDAEADSRHQRQGDDHRIAEPVMVPPDVQHDLEGTDPEDQQGKADIVDGQRSEEHASELQSLMRISYAVFCLKKKKKKTKEQNISN